MSESRQPQQSTGATRQRNRRRQIVVNKPMQTRLVLSATWPSALCLAATAMLIAFACKRLHDEALQADVELPSLMLVFGMCTVFLIVATLYVVFSALMLSHRIAGPVYNMARTMERFRSGDRGARVRLRTRDHLGDAAEEINTMLEWTAEQLGQHGKSAPDRAKPEDSSTEMEHSATASAGGS